MFTGLIEAVGKVAELKTSAAGFRLRIRTELASERGSGRAPAEAIQIDATAVAAPSASALRQFTRCLHRLRGSAADTSFESTSRSSDVGSPETMERPKHLVLILAREFTANLATPALIADARGQLVYYNEAAEGVVGRRFAEIGEVPMDEWIAGVRAQWAAARAAASQSGSDGGAWLDGAAARSFTCDASVTPVVVAACSRSLRALPRSLRRDCDAKSLCRTKRSGPAA